MNRTCDESHLDLFASQTQSPAAGDHSLYFICVVQPLLLGEHLYNCTSQHFHIHGGLSSYLTAWLRSSYATCTA